MKDLFSEQAAAYAAYRPAYPLALGKAIAKLQRYRGVAWDCATGNGQLAMQLAEHFALVCASDASAAQLRQAPANNSIHYSVQPAEHTDYPDHYFDVVTVAQAIHWLDIEAFYKEVRRVAKPEGHLVVIGYGLCSINDAVDAWLHNFYYNSIHTYWEPERKILEDEFQTLYFPFREVAFPSLQMEMEWTATQFIHYLSTWTAVQKCMAETKVNPLDDASEKLWKIWPAAEKRTVRWPLFIKAGAMS